MEPLKNDAAVYLLTWENTHRVPVSEKANYQEVYHIHFYKINRTGAVKNKPSTYLWVRVEGNFHF